MEIYELPYNFKRDVVIDAIDVLRQGDLTLDRWAEEYSFFQEVMFPGERDFVRHVATSLDGKKFGFDPHSSPVEVYLILKELDRK